MVKLFLTGYPIPISKTEEILDYIKRDENVSSLWMPHSGRTDFAIQLQSKAGLFNKEWGGREFLVLDVSLDSPYLETRFEEIKARVKSIVAGGKKATVILDSFSLEKAAFIKYVFALRHDLPLGAINFLSLAFESEFFARRTQKTDMSLIYNTLVKVPYYTEEEAINWLTYEAPQESSPRSGDVNKQIYDYCGGVFGLLMNLARTVIQVGSINTALQGEQMKNTLEHLWGRFSERERLILKAIATEQRIPPYTFELAYMKEHRLITSDNKLIGTWVKGLTEKSAPIEIEVQKDSLIWNGVNLLDLFTPTEQGIIIELTKKNELSREELSKLLWGSQSQEKYSDWAIDQTISRMRKKLVMAGISEEKFRTVKGKGLKLEGVIVK
ncbi:MAG: hypothetical protein UW69_C0018G0015 [Microgenomates group bacterium GW2011_GWA2_44_7]|nr:MAG: hypothetical protein UW69_C0018G0015 [Microgenomates group bacterium GW2011_GWA2_44_7]KKW02823.1 MAG: hypothetical protein UY36_C0001G0015 [Parcubacteria group bacterium GW2011_GWA1_49_11]